MATYGITDNFIYAKFFILLKDCVRMGEPFVSHFGGFINFLRNLILAEAFISFFFLICVMGFKFTIGTVRDNIDLRRLRDFVDSQDLGYLRYHEWVSRAVGEIEIRYKEAIVSYEGGIVVGNLIWQKHKEVRGLLELKNLRVADWSRGRGLAAFMLRQVEVEASKTKGILGIIGDIREEQKSIRQFMKSRGYTELFGASLYHPSEKEMIVFKPLVPNLDPYFLKDVEERFFE